METYTVPKAQARRVHAGWRPAFALTAFVIFLAALTPGRPSRGADLEYGAYLASECTTCHRADGETEGIPAIVGWDEQHFIDALKAYLGTERDNPTMRTIVKRLTDEDMEALAAYYNSLAN